MKYDEVCLFCNGTGIRYGHDSPRYKCHCRDKTITAIKEYTKQNTISREAAIESLTEAGFLRNGKLAKEYGGDE